MKLIKIICLFFTLLIFPKISNTNEKINLADYIQSFSWKKRIVLFITKDKYVHFINETDDFFKKNNCENEERNLKYIRIVGDDIKNYIFPDKYENKFGIWLIGYDGQDKAHSTNISLLKKIHDIIDQMPIRKKELIDNSGRNKKC